MSGSLLAQSSANTITQLSIGGTLTATGTVKAYYLNNLTVQGDLAGLVKGFGPVTATRPYSLNTVTVGGVFTGTIAAVSGAAVGTVNLNTSLNNTGQILENDPVLDMQALNVVGSFSGLVSVASLGSMTVGGNFSGQVAVSGPLNTMTVGGNLTGTVSAATIGTVTVSGNLTGQVSASQSLGTATVGGSTSGSISAPQVSSLSASNAHGPVVLQLLQGGVQLSLEADAVDGSSLALVSFAYVYDGTSGPNPRLSVHVSNGDPVNEHFDLSLVSSGSAADFDLALLDAPGGAAGIRDVAIAGNLLPGGIQLPLDNLGSVAVWGDAAAGAVQAASAQAVAFGSLTGADHTVAAQDASGEDAAQLLDPSTAIVQANGTFRVPFSEARPVALFLATGAGGGCFDDASVLLSDQLADGVPVTALVSAAPAGDSADDESDSVIQTVALLGHGGAIQTDQPITTAITSTGPLGDLILGAERGLVADVTAPSIFGNIDANNGPIAGTIQTTGQRIDPRTGAVSFVAADFGSTLADASGTIVCTTTVHAAGGISGRLISRGNLVSQVLSDGDISGLIAAQGDIGVIQRNPDGTASVDASGALPRFGGIGSCGDVSGQVLALGNIFGDIIIGGDLTGRIAVRGQPVAGLDPQRIGILGNIIIGGQIDEIAAIVSGGLIGDATGGTQLSTGDDIESILAAKGAINFGETGEIEDAAIFANVGATPGDPNAAAIDAVFSQNGQPLAFDQLPLDLGGLDVMLLHLAALQVG